MLLALFGFLSAFSWLLPNHQLPWTSFHTDVWLAMMLCLLLPLSWWRSAGRGIPVPMVSVIFIVLVLIFLLQWLYGQQPFAGEVWIHTLYLLGATLAVAIGQGERVGAGSVLDWLMAAIVIAGVVSVGLQLYQLSGYDNAGIWIAIGNSGRPSANLNQPNRLSTLLLWSVLSIFWGVLRGRLALWGAIPLASWLLLGVALCNSRTAWLAVILLCCASYYWRRYWPGRQALRTVFGLAAWFFLCTLVINYSHPQFGNRLAGAVSEASGDLRLLAWRTLVGALIDQPWFGYGIGRTAAAHLLHATDHAPLHVVFAQAHNLFLDLLIWCGIPLGAGISFLLLRWFWKAFRNVNSAKSALLFMCLLVVANHAMLEFPLHYAHFLLPAGVMAGALMARQSATTIVFYVPRWVYGCAVGIVICMLAVTISDYFKVEHKYELLRIEWAGMPMEINPQPPEVLVLTQLRASIKEARTVPRVGMSAEEMQALRDVLLYAHRPIDFMHYIRALRLNGQPAEADLWLARFCSVVTADYCARAQSELSEADKGVDGGALQAPPES